MNKQAVRVATQSSAAAIAIKHAAPDIARSACTDGLHAYLHIDRDLRVLGANNDARWLLNAGVFGVAQVGDRLHFECAAATQAVLTFFANEESGVAEVPLGQATMRAFCSRLARVCGTGARGSYLVTVVGLGRAGNLIALGMRLGLSAAEAGLLCALCTDSSVVEYAQQRKVKECTARTQMKTMLRKLGVHSQVEAVRLALNLMWTQAATRAQ